jgi:hypothetical protein
VKDFLQYWGSTIFTSIVILGLSTIIIVQDVRHSANQIKLYEELIDMHHFNGVLNSDNAVKELQLDHAEELLDQQHDVLRNMYNELMKLKGLSPIPGENKKNLPNRSEA